MHCGYWLYSMYAIHTMRYATNLLFIINNSNRFQLISGSYELEYVTCGSVMKLVNTRSNVRLHSHDVKYGSGSGQQVEDFVKKC